MADPPALSADDIAGMTVPAWERAKDAIGRGDLARANELIDQAVARWRGLQDYSINWITSLLSFIGREMGEEAVERALRITGDEFLRPRRDTGGDWNALPAVARAKAHHCDAAGSTASGAFEAPLLESGRGSGLRWAHFLAALRATRAPDRRSTELMHATVNPLGR